MRDCVVGAFQEWKRIGMLVVIARFLAGTRGHGQDSVLYAASARGFNNPSNSSATAVDGP
jgi:hypothetical protein